MKKGIFKAVCLVLLLAGLNLQAGEKQNKIIISSVNIMNSIMKIPETSIPPRLLRSAKAIAIIPHVIKAGLVIGGRFGRGVLLVKQKNGVWSPPCFINLTGGSIGWQIGVQSTDIVLVFKNRRGVDGIVSGKFTLGADAAVAAGPVGRNALAATDGSLNAEIYSYSRSKGLFAGIALDGSVLSVNDDYNEMYYKKEVSPTDIFNRYHIRIPKSARVLIDTVSRYTR